jgi:hypothetical protein
VRKKCEVVLHFLGTPHYQALGQGVNSNVEHILELSTFANQKKLIDTY